MTSREQRRAWILTRVVKHELTMTEAAELVGLSVRQLWRLRVAFEHWVTEPDSPAFPAIMQRRPESLGEIKRAVAKNVEAELGDHPVRSPLRALVFTARRR